MSFINELKKVLQENSGKISASYIEKYLNYKNTKVTHTQITPQHKGLCYKFIDRL